MFVLLDTALGTVAIDPRSALTNARAIGTARVVVAFVGDAADTMPQMTTRSRRALLPLPRFVAVFLAVFAHQALAFCGFDAMAILAFLRPRTLRIAGIVGTDATVVHAHLRRFTAGDANLGMRRDVDALVVAANRFARALGNADFRMFRQIDARIPITRLMPLTARLAAAVGTAGAVFVTPAVREDRDRDK